MVKTAQHKKKYVNDYLIGYRVLSNEGICLVDVAAQYIFVKGMPLIKIFLNIKGKVKKFD